jgi:trehalose-phosphatase
VSIAPEFHDPQQLGLEVAGAERPLLIGLDIDGVLSPLVDHADDARLLPGVADVLGRLVSVDDVAVAAVSGRALQSMRTFGLPDSIQLVGSHGMEAGDQPFRPLDTDERSRLDHLISLADDAAIAAGNGCWVEHKQASVAVHTRTADPASGRAALEQLAVHTSAVDGATIKAGSDVLELFARHASKGTAITSLSTEVAAACTVFVGDDLTDEEAFAMLADGDITIKVGTAATIATRRLRDPEAVLAFLATLTDACET